MKKSTTAFLYSTVILLLCFNMIINSSINEIRSKEIHKNKENLAFLQLQNLSNGNDKKEKSYFLELYSDYFDYSSLVALFKENQYEEVIIICYQFNDYNESSKIKYVSDALKTLTNLKSLTLQYIHYEESFTYLSEALMNKTSLTYLDLSYSRLCKSSDDFFKSLNTLTNVEMIILAWIINDGDRHDASKKVLASEVIFKVISQMNKLTYLDLQFSGGIFSEGESSTKLLESLSTKTKLTYLNLLDAYIEDDKDIISLGDALKNLTLLKYLNLNHLSRDRYQGTHHGFLNLAQAIALMPNLETLDLGKNDLNVDEAIELGKALQQKTKIQYLDLRGCFSSSEQASIELAKALMLMNDLRYLDIRNIRLGTLGAISFGNALENKIKLEELYLNHIEISKEGILSFTKVFNSKPNLKTLKFSIKEELDNETSDIIINSLLNAPNVTTLSINGGSHNKKGLVSDDNLVALGNYLKSLKNLKILNLDGNEITKQGAEFILDKLKQNQTLKSLSLQNNILDPYEKSDTVIFTKSAVIQNNNLKQRIVRYRDFRYPNPEKFLIFTIDN